MSVSLDNRSSAQRPEARQPDEDQRPVKKRAPS